jgi:hypothetical protein
MPEEALESPEETQENSQVEPSDETETSQDVDTDYKAQYDELRSKFNERDTEISEARELRELAKELGYTPTELAKLIREGQQDDDTDDDDELETEYEDPTAKRVQQLEARLEAQETEDAFLGLMQDLEEKHGIEFPGPFVEHAWQQGINHGRMPEDVFDKDWPAFVEAATTWSEKQKAAAKKSKAKAAKAPSGGPGSRAPDLSDQSERLSELEREIEAARSSAE